MLIYNHNIIKGGQQMKLSKVKIIEVMEHKGIKTQTELAKRLGITKNQLSVILSNTYNPVKSTVSELCNVLGVDIMDIIDTEHKVVEVIEEPNTVTAIELFAGGGGCSLGLELAGIKAVKYVEIDATCCETLKRNRPNWNVVNADVATVDFTEYKGKVDVVTGGSPCQAFSYAGKKLGFEDTRGTLFYQYARCVKEVQPKLFMFENVRGLISHDEGRTLETILNVFQDLKYNVQYRVLSANDYGVAQKRERLIIIGTKDGVDFEYPTPLDYKPVLRDALKDVPPSEGQEYSENKRKVLDLVPPGGCWINLPVELQKSYLGASYNSGGGKRGMARRISWDEPCLTLTCSPAQKQTERCHPDETRPFTTREYARIQSFPDTWTFAGSTGQIYKQIGNAIAVEFARHLGIQIKKSIETYKSKKTL